MKRVGRGEGRRWDVCDGKWTRIRVTPLHSHQSLNSEGGEDERKSLGGKKKKKNALFQERETTTMRKKRKKKKLETKRG